MEMPMVLYLNSTCMLLQLPCYKKQGLCEHLHNPGYAESLLMPKDLACIAHNNPIPVELAESPCKAAQGSQQHRQADPHTAGRLHQKEQLPC